jgi:glycosyltransferase involved in cell wall biosynthesis
MRGGAARSAYRLHRALLAQAVNSTMLVREKVSQETSVQAAPIEAGRTAKTNTRQWKRIQKSYIDENRSELSNTKFSLARPGFDLSRHPAVQEADVVHLHWVSGFLSPAAVAALARLGKPMVWTLHDQRAFTGGCHFSAGCDGFERSCDGCPQLRHDPLRITRAALEDSRTLVPREIVVVSPSRWLADCARRSTVFSGCRVEVIPYGIDTNVFRPHDRELARRELELAPDATAILFGADNIGEKRKGFDVLLKAVAIARADPAFARATSERRVQFLIFGDCPSEAVGKFPVPIRSLGRFHSEVSLAKLFSAADLLLLPSLEDNLPNILLEAMCCGVAPLAHAVGGIPDAVTDNVHGRLVPVGEAEKFASALVSALQSPDTVARWREACRMDAPNRFSLNATAQGYLKLYESIPKPAAPARDGEWIGTCPQTTSGLRMDSLFPELLRAADSHRRARRWSFLPDWMRGSGP